MTRYEWPAVSDRRSVDDPAGRSQHLSRFRVALAPAPGAAPEPAPDIAALAPPLPGGTDPVWVPIGPTTVLGGQAAGSPRVAGRIRDLAITDDGKRAYAAAAGGGVWYTDDFATNWRPVGGWATTTLVQPDQSAGTLSTGALHVEFGDADDVAADLVVVGTGELKPYAPGTPGGKLGGVGMLFATGPAHRTPTRSSRIRGPEWPAISRAKASTGSLATPIRPARTSSRPATGSITTKARTPRTRSGRESSPTHSPPTRTSRRSSPTSSGCHATTA